MAKPAGDQKSQKVPKIESLLLQTYLTSLLSLVLCVTMFFGTSYAWFSSEVSNTANEIYVGRLRVALQTGEGTGWSLTDADNKLFDQNIRWEPGFTTLDTLHVTNEGDLAFKYELRFIGGSARNSAGEDASLSAVAGCFDVYVYDHYGKNYTKPTSFKSITNTKLEILQ